jgi:hypothetical protein
VTAVKGFPLELHLDRLSRHNRSCFGTCKRTRKCSISFVAVWPFISQIRARVRLRPARVLGTSPMSRLSARGLAIVIAPAVFVLAGSARAHPSKGSSSSRDATPEGGVIPETTGARALRLQDQGDRAMLDMRYVDALAAYEQARELDPDNVGLDYSLARAHQLLGEFPEALAALERFERRASLEQRATVGRLKQLFIELRSRVSTLQLHCSQPGARVLVRDRVVGTTPLPGTRLPAGSATMQVELEGFFPVTREVVLPAGGALELSLDLHARSIS